MRFVSVLINVYVHLCTYVCTSPFSFRYPFSVATSAAQSPVANYINHAEFQLNRFKGYRAPGGRISQHVAVNAVNYALWHCVPR